MGDRLVFTSGDTISFATPPTEVVIGFVVGRRLSFRKQDVPGYQVANIEGLEWIRPVQGEIHRMILPEGKVNPGFFLGDDLCPTQGMVEVEVRGLTPPLTILSS
ncbi:MAG: hypothetical protein WCV93_04440 [Candidatus Shapirobacteria bacterium]|jgi:hypothetical protein